MNRSRGFALAAATLAALFIALFVVRFVEPFGLDQGLFACFARWVPRGWLPYRDLYDTKPPLLLYWFGLARLFPGDVRQALFLLEGAWLSATLWCAFAVARHAWGRTAGLAAASMLLLGLWAPALGGFWARLQAEELLALPMLISAGLAMRGVHGRRSGRDAFGAGVFAGICGLFKVPALVILVSWSLAWLWGAPARSALRRIGFLALGASTPWLVAFAWFLAHGEAQRFVFAVFVHARVYADAIAVPLTVVIARFPEKHLVPLALPIASGVFGLVVLFRRHDPRAKVLATWMSCVVAAVLAQKQLAGYHGQLLVPPFALAGGFGIAAVLETLRTRPRRLPALVAASSLVAGLVHAGRVFSSAYGDGARYLSGATTRAAYLRALQTGEFSMAIEESAARYVAEHTRATDKVLVWTVSPGIHALADRAPATRYAFHKLLLTDAPLSVALGGVAARRDELVRTLVSEPPAMVIVGHGDATGFEPSDSQSQLNAFPELRDLLARDYVVRTRIGRLTLFGRR